MRSATPMLTVTDTAFLPRQPPRWRLPPFDFFGRSVARAEANRLHDLVRLARASGFHTKKA